MTPIRRHAVVTRDHKLRLDIDVPRDVPVGDVELIVTIAPAAATRPARQRGIDALRQVAARGDLARTIPDPSAWQRDVRDDRALPGRD
jgi:hypothetical protein